MFFVWLTLPRDTARCTVSVEPSRSSRSSAAISPYRKPLRNAVSTNGYQRGCNARNASSTLGISSVVKNGTGPLVACSRFLPWNHFRSAQGFTKPCGPLRACWFLMPLPRTRRDDGSQSDALPSMPVLDAERHLVRVVRCVFGPRVWLSTGGKAMSDRIERAAKAMRAGDDERGLMSADERWMDRARVGLAAASCWRRFYRLLKEQATW